MNNRTIISQRRDKYNSVIKHLFELVREDTASLVILALNKGASKKEVADALGIADPSLIAKKYLKKTKEDSQSERDFLDKGGEPDAEN